MDVQVVVPFDDRAFEADLQRESMRKKTIINYCFVFGIMLFSACTKNPFGPISEMFFTPAQLTFDKQTYSFGEVGLGSAAVTKFTLYNTSEVEAVGCEQLQLSDSINFVLNSTTCDKETMSPNEACEVEVLSQPQSVGAKSLTLSRKCKNTEVTTTENQITCIAIVPDLEWSPLTKNYGNIFVGANSSTETFVLTNNGTGAASSCTAPYLTDNINFQIVADTCGVANLASSATCQVQVRARPQSTGNKKTHLIRTCGVGGTVSTTPNQIRVDGVYTNLAWSPLTYDFGSVNVGANSSTTNFILSNTGTASATGCSAPIISNTTDFTIVSETCSTNNLAIGDSCSVTVRANPASGGLRSATLSRTCSYGGTVATTANQIQVTGLSAVLSVSPLTYNFGNENVNFSTQSTTFTISNTGVATATGCSAPVLSDPVNFTIVQDNCGAANLNAGANCTVLVKANPTLGIVHSTTLSRTCTVGSTGATQTNGVTVNGLFKTANTVVSVAAASAHSCALTFDGVVKCWGRNDVGQLGYNDTTNRGDTIASMALQPVFLGLGVKARDIMATQNLSCALLEDYTMKCWGQSTFGTFGTTAGSMEALGSVAIENNLKIKKISSGGWGICIILSNDTVKCTQAGALTAAGSTINLGVGRTAKEISVGQDFACSILDNNNIYCWGGNGSGQQGGAGTAAKKIASGYFHSCAILTNDAVRCWGSNGSGQLGNEGAFADVYLGVGRTAKQISAQIHHSCAVLDDDSVKCWGYNAYGQLGYDDTTNRGSVANSMQTLSSVNLGVGRTAQFVSAGHLHTCTVLDNNTVKCWGSNSSGRLGYGDSADRGAAPLGFSTSDLPAVNLGQTVKDIAIGNYHTCAILNDNSLKCWGMNWNGKLGYNDNVSRGANAGDMAALPAIHLGVGRTAKKVAIGWHHMCVILDTDGVKCWGYNNAGQLGYNDTTSRGNVAGSMESLSEVYLGVGRTAKQIVAGYNHTCALLDDNTVKCWGSNSSGQLGYNDTASRGHVANSMQTLGTVYLGVGRTALSISAKWAHTCAVLDDYSLKCWGSNGTGELGQNDTTNRGDVANSMQNLNPIYLGVGRTAVSVSAGQNQTCAILDDGTSKCWGHGLQGNLGTGTTTQYGHAANSMQSLGVINFGVGRTVSEISSGYAFTCARLDNNTARCFGYGGPLGYNNANWLYAPADAIVFRSNQTIKKIVASAATSLGGLYACAILNDDTLECWGRNGGGQLGYDDWADRGVSGYSVQNTIPHAYSP